MSEPYLSRPDYIKKTFKRAHRLDIWGAVLEYEVEPQKTFTATEVLDKTLQRSQRPHPTLAMVCAELVELTELNMVERVFAERTKNIPFARLDSLMWPVIAGAITAVGLMYPDIAET